MAPKQTERALQRALGGIGWEMVDATRLLRGEEAGAQVLRLPWRAGPASHMPVWLSTRTPVLCKTRQQPQAVEWR